MKIAYFGFEWGRVPSNVTLTNTSYAVGQGRFPGSPIGLQGAASASVAVALTSATSVYGSFWLLSSGAYPATTNIVNVGVVNLQILSGTSIAIQVNGSTVATQTVSALTQATYFVTAFFTVF